MKKIIFITLIVALMANLMDNQAQEPAGKSQKILVAYFSWGGNTRTIASQIQQQTGGDLFEIKTVKPYPVDYNECIALAKKEQQANARPALVDAVKNWTDYDIVFIGYPNWWGTMPKALFTFLEKHDTSGKTIVPFNTHGGGRWGRSLDDLKKECPNATLREGLTISANEVRRSKEDIVKWLQKIGITSRKQ